MLFKKNILDLESNKYLYEALDISESLDDKSTIIEIKEKLVANMSAINKYNLAESILNESFVIRESLSNDSMNVQFKQCRMLAPLYYESGKYVQSLENFKECAQHDSIQYQENMWKKSTR